LSILRAVVLDIPMQARYGDEVSNLSVPRAIPEFLFKHVKNFCKRIFYNYYLRDVSVASFQLPLGLMFGLGGAAYGGYQWLKFSAAGIAAPTGTVVLPVLCILMGTQLLLAFINHDVGSVPRRPIQQLYLTENQLLEQGRPF
jgi:dolichol-phosphate mannosyltransferase